MAIPPVQYLDAFEAQQYQTASTNDELEAAWEEEGDPVAKAFLLMAEAYLAHVHGEPGQARATFQEIEDVLADEEGSWQVRTLLQHAEQCQEYLSMGKPLPDLPSGL